MLASLEAARAGERRFLADASHELRTPVTTLLGNVEYAARHGADPEVLEDLQRDARRLARLVDDLLVLERAGAAACPRRARSISTRSCVGVIGAHAGDDGGRWRRAGVDRGRAGRRDARSRARSRTWSRTRSCTAPGGRVTIASPGVERPRAPHRAGRGSRSGSGRPRPAVRAVLARPGASGRPGRGSGCRSSRRSSSVTAGRRASTGRRSRSSCRRSRLD